MCSSSFVAPKVCSDKFKVGLIALTSPPSAEGPISAGTALVQFEQPLPSHAMDTHVRAFRAAEKVFRDVHRLNKPGISVRESLLCQAVTDVFTTDIEPDGEVDGAKVWLSGI